MDYEIRRCELELKIVREKLKYFLSQEEELREKEEELAITKKHLTENRLKNKQREIELELRMLVLKNKQLPSNTTSE